MYFYLQTSELLSGKAFNFIIYKSFTGYNTGTYTKKVEKIGSNINSQKFLRQKGLIPLFRRVLLT